MDRAAAGSLGGPVGTVVGTVVGAVAGGLAGKAVGENNDPTVEIDYWRNEYRNRPYYDDRYEFEDYEPAFRAGASAYNPNTASDWDKSEVAARSRWESESPNSQLDWDRAKLAAKDAYTRMHSRRPAKA